jgi:hypothetical protein
MFMIHTPQSIDLLATPVDDPAPTAPDNSGTEEAAQPEHHGTIRFDHEGDDVSKCRMIITRDDKVFTYVFNTRGNLVSSTYEDDKTREAKAAQAKAAEEAAREAEKAQLAERDGHETHEERVAARDENRRETERANPFAM